MLAFKVIIIFLLGFATGVISHKGDLSRNFKKYGDAKAWFYPIKIEKEENKE